MKLLLVSCALLMGCGAEPVSNTQEPWSGDKTAGSVNVRLADAAAQSLEGTRQSDEADTVPDGLNPRYYELSNYRKYPDDVRLLLRRADIENSLCRGGPGNDPETYRACNRRELIMIELEKKGWCWGGSDVGYLEHWLKCADDPYRPPGYRRTPHFYSEEEIRESETKE